MSKLIPIIVGIYIGLTVYYYENKINNIQEECHNIAVMSAVNGHRMAVSGHGEAFMVLQLLELFATAKENINNED